MDAPHRGRAAHLRYHRPESRGWLRQLAVRLVHAGDLRVHPTLARRGALRLDELRNPGHWARRLRSPAADCLPDARLGLPRAHDAHDRLEPERILALPGAVRARTGVVERVLRPEAREFAQAPVDHERILALPGAVRARRRP